jgi:hypothetical protein
MAHAVIVHIYPDVDDSWGVDLVEDALTEAIDARGVGEFDGHDIALDGSGEVMLYAYGEDADALYEVMEPVLLGVPPREGSYAIKWYGEAGDPEVREERVELRPQ